MMAAPLGLAYGALPLLRPDFDWGHCVLGASLTTVGGLLPDLDSDSGVPVRELFGMASALAAVMLLKPIHDAGLNIHQALAVAIGAYLFIRYVVSSVFRRMTVHRGMFHSVPAILIAGLVVYLAYPTFDLWVKLYMSGAVMVGYLSHLVLDEAYSVDFNGVRVRLNQFAGTALKFGSSSWVATLACYLLLFGLGYCVYSGGLPDLAKIPKGWRLSVSVPSPPPAP
jgi:hypothetical protein